MTECTTCDATRFKKVAHERTFTVGERRFKVAIEGEQCDNCGTIFWMGPSLAAAERAVARGLVDQGATDSASFRYIRVQAGIAAKDLATLLNVSPETVSRWETGKREPDRAAWATLAAMFIESLEGSTRTRERLVAARKSKAPARAVRLKPISKAG